MKAETNEQQDLTIEETPAFQNASPLRGLADFLKVTIDSGFNRHLGA